MEKIKLDRFESAFMNDGIASQISMLEKWVIMNIHKQKHAKNEGCIFPNDMTDAHIDCLYGLIEKIESVFDSVHDIDYLKSRLSEIPRYKKK